MAVVVQVVVPMLIVVRSRVLVVVRAGARRHRPSMRLLFLLVPLSPSALHPTPTHICTYLTRVALPSPLVGAITGGSRTA
ncbi:hypothetical protein CPC08DRAFT_716936 [Agrocybe pediades]|nr:hypothetical protein CPC08DRAFT_716936 [Agrocybe pediades]